jgi:serine/threonine-protein kinase
MPLDTALRTAIDVAEALDKAHCAGIVHRDLKPGNIMLTPVGARLLDFGLAKATVPAGAASGLSMLPTTPPGLTAHGSLLGTFQYMAPEQLEGREADTRTDIFAFGAILYEMLTGRKAFEGKNQATLIAAIIASEPASIATVQPLATPTLDRIVRRCLAKDPEARWQTARDLRAELQWTADRGAQVDLPSMQPIARWHRWSWTVAAAALTLAAFLAVGWWRATRPVDHPLMRFGAEIIRSPNGILRLDDTIVAASQPGTWLALSRDGTRLAVQVRDGDGRLRLATRRLDEGRFTAIPGTENATSAFFSPDGQWIAFFADGKLRKIAVPGGPPIVLCSSQNFPSASWGDDGKIVAALSTRGGLSQVSSDGGAPVPVTELRNGGQMHRWPQVNPLKFEPMIDARSTRLAFSAGVCWSLM